MITKLGNQQIDINCPFNGLQDKDLQSLIEDNKVVCKIYWKTEIDWEKDELYIHGTIEKVILVFQDNNCTALEIKDYYNNKFTSFEITNGSIKLAPKSISIEFDDREFPMTIKFDI